MKKEIMLPKLIPLAIDRFTKRYNLPLKNWTWMVNYDAYEIELENGDVIQVSGPTLMRYED